MTCLVFYESLDSYYKLYTKFAEKNGEKSSKSCILDPKETFFSESNSSLSIDKPFEKKLFESPKIHSQLIDEFEIKSQRISEIFLFKGKDKQISSSKINMSNIYVPKCICLVSLYPFFNEMTRILRGILKYSRKKKIKIKKPIELVIQNLIIDVPCPPKGIWKVLYYIKNSFIF